MFSPKLLPVFFAVMLAASLLLTSRTSGQTSRGRSVKVPVFRSVTDSVNYHFSMDQLASLYRQEHVDEVTSDSLRAVIDRIVATGIARYNIIYYPSADYVQLAELDTIRDLSRVRSLTISGKNAEFPERIYQCDSLMQIELVNTSIKRLPRRLSGLRNLKEVIICNNKPNGRLKLGRNDRITELTIHGDDPMDLPRSFRMLKNLKTLDLSENHLEKFPKGIRRNRKLVSLDLQENDLTLRGRERLPACRSLERLALQHNRIEMLPASVSRFKALKRLSLNYNRISGVHPRIAALSKLEYISFYQNNLDKIPPAVYRLPALKVIDLFHNNIDALDTTLNDWKKLEVLYLAHNKIVYLPANLDKLVSLTALYLDHNRIDRLPESVCRLSRLQVLKINHNWIKELPANVLDLTLLEELDISNNYIQDIPPAIFDFRHFKIFSLANNPWSPATKSFLDHKVRELRAREVFVHVIGEKDIE